MTPAGIKLKDQTNPAATMSGHTTSGRHADKGGYATPTTG